MTGETIPRGLYGLTSPEVRVNLFDSVREMIGNGAGTIQYRDKATGIDEASFLANAEKIMRICEDNGTVFIVNDRVGVAERLGTNVHVGPEDESPADIRERGFGRIIGLSIDSYGRYEMARDSGLFGHVNYVGAGPVFRTPLKSKEPMGLDQLRSVIGGSPCPVFAIGGMDGDNIGYVLETNPAGIAIMYAKFCADEKLIRTIAEHY